MQNVMNAVGKYYTFVDMMQIFVLNVINGYLKIAMIPTVHSVLIGRKLLKLPYQYVK